MKHHNIKNMVYRIRENGRKVCIFDKITDIKQKLNTYLPEIEDNRLLVMLSHCRARYEGNLYYGRRTYNQEELKTRKPRELTELERVLYEFMLKNKLNPSTTYRWFLACRIPEDIKEKLIKKQIPIRKAMQIAHNRRRVQEYNTSLFMLEEMRTLVRGL